MCIYTSYPHREASTDVDGSIEMSLMAAAHQAARGEEVISFKPLLLLTNIPDVWFVIRMWENDAWNLL